MRNIERHRRMRPYDRRAVQHVVSGDVRNAQRQFEALFGAYTFTGLEDLEVLDVGHQRRRNVKVSVRSVHERKPTIRDIQVNTFVGNNNIFRR